MKMGLKLKVKSAVLGLTNTQKALLIFAASVLPPVITYLQQVGAGAPVTVQSGALLGSAILGGVLAFIVKQIDS